MQGFRFIKSLACGPGDVFSGGFFLLAGITRFSRQLSARPKFCLRDTLTSQREKWLKCVRNTRCCVKVDKRSKCISLAANVWDFTALRMQDKGWRLKMRKLLHSSCFVSFGLRRARPAVSSLAVAPRGQLPTVRGVCSNNFGIPKAGPFQAFMGP